MTIPCRTTAEPQRKSQLPVAQFGRDHWSTLAYIETCVVDAGGLLDVRRMRCDVDRHPLLSHLPRVLGKSPTRLRDGSLLEDHDDWDCLDDMEAAGWLRNVGTGIRAVIEMTDAGWTIAAALRKHMSTKRSTGASYATFEPPADSQGRDLPDRREG